jgi:hypothetical protein
MMSSAVINPFEDNDVDENDDAIENAVVGPDILVCEIETNAFDDGGSAVRVCIRSKRIVTNARTVHGEYLTI